MSNCMRAENAVLCQDVSGELFGPFEGDCLDCMATGSKPTFRIAFAMGNEMTGWRGCDISAAYLSCITSPGSSNPRASNWPCVVGIDAVDDLLHHGLLLTEKSMIGTSVVLCRRSFPQKRHTVVPGIGSCLGKELSDGNMWLKLEIIRLAS